jgi:hypothetical protein
MGSSQFTPNADVIVVPGGSPVIPIHLKEMFALPADVSEDVLTSVTVNACTTNRRMYGTPYVKLTVPLRVTGGA